MFYYGNGHKNYYGADGANSNGHENYYSADGTNGNGHGHEIYYYGADGANGNGHENYYFNQNYRGRCGRGGRGGCGGKRIGHHNGSHPLSDTAREAFVALLAEKQSRD